MDNRNPALYRPLHQRKASVSTFYICKFVGKGRMPGPRYAIFQWAGMMFYRRGRNTLREARQELNELCESLEG